MDVQALAKLISTTSSLEVLSLYNVKLNSDVSFCTLWPSRMRYRHYCIWLFVYSA